MICRVGWLLIFHKLNFYLPDGITFQAALMDNPPKKNNPSHHNFLVGCPPIVLNFKTPAKKKKIIQDRISPTHPTSQPFRKLITSLHDIINLVPAQLLLEILNPSVSANHQALNPGHLSKIHHLGWGDIETKACVMCASG